MGHHIDSNKDFQSDHKIRLQQNGTLQPNHIVLDFDDPDATLALWVFAKGTRDKELGEDVETRLRTMEREKR